MPVFCCFVCSCNDFIVDDNDVEYYSDEEEDCKVDDLPAAPIPAAAPSWQTTPWQTLSRDDADRAKENDVPDDWELPTATPIKGIVL